MATITTAIAVFAGNMPIVKLTYAWNSMGFIIVVEAKPKCVKILVRYTTEVATRVIPDES